MPCGLHIINLTLALFNYFVTNVKLWCLTDKYSKLKYMHTYDTLKSIRKIIKKIIFKEDFKSPMNY